MQKIIAALMKLVHEIRAEYTFAPEQDSGLERRLFRLISLTISLLMFFVLIPANFIQGIFPLVNIPIALLGGVSFFLYRAARKGSHHTKTLLVTLLATINVAWFLNGGNDGSVSYFIFSVCMYPLIVFSNRKRWLIMMGIVANGCALLVISQCYPWLVTPYGSASDRTADLVVGMIVGSLAIILVLWVVLCTYRREQERLKELNLQLEYEIAGRMRTEEDLLRSNRELAATEEKLRRQLAETIAAQHALLRSEERYGQLVEHVNCIILRMKPSGEITFVNEFAELFFGDDRTEIIGRNITALLGPDAVAGGDHPLLPQVAGSAFTPCRLNEGESVCKDGRHAWISWSTTSLRSPGGEISEILCVGQDVTESRQLQQQGLQRQKLESIGLLAGGIAHDFNNLLTPIMGGAELILAAVNPEDPSHRRATTIRNAAEKAAELVKQILNFSSKRAVDATWHDLNEIVGSFMAMLRRTIREDIDIRYNPCGNACPVFANRTQIEQILLNLAVNAQDAVTGSGMITIETSRSGPESGSPLPDQENGSGRYLTLTFGDSGCGMDEHVIGQIFDPFFTTKPVGSGTGLGLSTVYGIVKQHNGHIEVESSRGHGTVFRIFLPEAAARRRTGAQPAGASAVRGPAEGTVLLVEDNPMVLEIACELLTGRGLAVLAADTPEAAISHALDRREPIDLLVSDVVMPCMNGPELYQKLLQLQPGIKVLFMSGYADKISLFRDDGDQDLHFIAKPFSAESFLASVDQLLSPPS